jgi:hypothetical protein
MLGTDRAIVADIAYVRNLVGSFIINRFIYLSVTEENRVCSILKKIALATFAIDKPIGLVKLDRDASAIPGARSFICWMPNCNGLFHSKLVIHDLTDGIIIFLISFVIKKATLTHKH